MSPNAKATDPAAYRFGLICLASATFFTSLAGILLRLVEAADGWQVLFYRSLAFVATMLAFVVWRHGKDTARAFQAVGRPGLVVAGLLAAAFMLFIFALLNTTVASAVFTLSLSPFFAALFAWLALREAVAPATWAAMVLSLMGIGLMFGDGLAAGSITGNLLALVCCLCYSAALVAMRRGRRVDMMPAVCLAGVTAALVAAIMAPDLRVSPRDLLLAVTLGVVQLGFQYILLTTGTRSVPAAEIALVGRLTLVMAPLWVWVGVGEVPSPLTLMGGLIVLPAVTGHGLLALHRSRAV